jgi:hypothetical protein
METNKQTKHRIAVLKLINITVFCVIRISVVMVENKNASLSRHIAINNNAKKTDKLNRFRALVTLTLTWYLDG